MKMKGCIKVFRSILPGHNTIFPADSIDMGNARSTLQAVALADATITLSWDRSRQSYEKAKRAPHQYPCPYDPAIFWISGSEASGIYYKAMTPNECIFGHKAASYDRVSNLIRDITLGGHDA